MTLEDLIDALGKATGPSRELDAEIDAVLRIGFDGLPLWARANFPNWRAKHRGTVEVVHDNGVGGLWWDSKPFTASIDAAVALLGGAEFEMTNLHGVARATVHNQGDYGPSYGNDECGNIPIAICIAALRSLHQEKNNAE